jgi:hypothetical protein
MGGVTRSQWPVYMKQAYRALKPGTGWVQCGEFNPSFKCDNGNLSTDSLVFKASQHLCIANDHADVVVPRGD